MNTVHLRYHITVYSNCLDLNSNIIKLQHRLLQNSKDLLQVATLESISKIILQQNIGAMSYN